MEIEAAIDIFDVLILTEGLDELWSKLGRHDPITQTHSHWVAHLTLETLTCIGAHPEFHSRIVLGALVHDIGKILIPSEILTRDGPLTAQELHCVQRGHVEYGSELLSNYPDIRPFAEGHHPAYSASRFNRAHLEPWQSFGLTVLCACDITDRMIRGFRGVTLSKSLAQIRHDLEVTFKDDPQIVDAVLTVSARHVNNPLALYSIKNLG